MIKLLIGGSPCTYWSIAKHGREIEASGVGWELFRNYVIALKKFKPDYFLYENNQSISKAIKEQISKELGVELMNINSALVSAQNRRRIYGFNWEVEQPEDRGIILSDILETGEDLSSREKAYALTATYSGAIPKNTIERKQRAMVAERIGTIEGSGNTAWDSKGFRVYSANGKSVTLCGNGGGGGAKTGLYAVRTENKYQYLIYEVKNGLITIKGEEYPIKLQDGFYIIRKLTPIECERLQTLPDDYTAGVSNTQRYKALGNGWTAKVIIHILNGALRDIPQDTPIQVLSMYDGIATGRYCLDKMGFKNVEYHAYEIDKFAIQIAMKNFPDIIQHGDAFAVRNDDWHI